MPKLLSTFTDSVLDSTIFYSFDLSGFIRHSKAFNPQDLDVDLTGKIALVTGANSGLGLITALALAKRNATVYLLCRNVERGTAAEQSIRKQSANDLVHFKQIDLCDITSIANFNQHFEEEHIDILIHNAGVLPTSYQESPQGLELTYATNIVGPHYLTLCLWSKLSKAKKARMIIVSSGGMYPVKMSIQKLQKPAKPFNGVEAYAMSKRAQVILAELWAEKGLNSEITVHSMHPGWADTPGVEQSMPAFWDKMKNRLRSPEQGADTIIWLAISQAAQQSSGQFWFDRKPRKIHFLPWTQHKQGLPQQLWNSITESLELHLEHKVKSI